MTVISVVVIHQSQQERSPVIMNYLESHELLFSQSTQIISTAFVIQIVNFTRWHRCIELEAGKIKGVFIYFIVINISEFKVELFTALLTVVEPDEIIIFIDKVYAAILYFN